LLADADGVVAVDARIRVAEAAMPGAARLAIAPYPKHFESAGAARDGTPITFRPVRPEDEPRLHDLFAHMSPADIRLRFFPPIRELSHSFAARLSQIDYDREMALLAKHGGLTLGIAGYFADPDRLRAEYAIAVRSDWKGRGVGCVLMTRLIDAARQVGIGEIIGNVLHENWPMLDVPGTRLHRYGAPARRHFADGAKIACSGTRCTWGKAEAPRLTFDERRWPPGLRFGLRAVISGLPLGDIAFQAGAARGPSIRRDV
jgi:GNAT superfamily N-acetyltransferase